MEIGPGRGQLPGVRRLARDSEVDAPARASLFEGLSRRELIQLAKATEDLAVPAGKQFCRKGTTGSELFVIVEGEAAVTEGRRRINTLPAARSTTSGGRRGGDGGQAAHQHAPTR
ncbi:MAG: hypothetical protein IT201_04820 [Thermoleophilia bacterium]|nr:hypothetical protein [Thermoleophilia bacterium]